MWVLFYDEIMPIDSEWKKNGGSIAYFRLTALFNQYDVISNVLGLTDISTHCWKKALSHRSWTRLIAGNIV